MDSKVLGGNKMVNMFFFSLLVPIFFDMMIKLGGASAPVTSRGIPLMPPIIIIGGIRLFTGH